MTWRDNMRPASFRGVPFAVEETESEHGRRVQSHVYPGRDEPYGEDLGRRPHEFTVEAFVIGDDYFAARDALLAAVNAPGPGTLIHPYLGEHRVLAAAARLVETTREGRLARLLITFAEAGLNLQPDAREDTAAAVEASAEAATADAEADFAETFTLEGQPAFTLADATEILDDLSAALSDVRIGLPAELREASEFLTAIDRLVPQVVALANNPLGIAREITGAIRRVRRLANAPGLILDALRGLADFDRLKADFKAATATRSVQVRNSDAVVAVIRRVAAVEMAAAATAVPLDNRQAALALRDDVAARLDAEILALGDAPETPASDALFDALRDLRADAVRHLTARGASLVPLIERSLAASLPALVLAHDLYEDVARDAEIVARNRVRHPGFLPAGVALELRAG